MGPAFHCAVGLCLAGVAGRHPVDTTTYSDQATALLVARGTARHVAQDSSVHDYRAQLRYRVSFGVSRRKWGDPLPVAVEEQAATVTWQLPNDLRVDIVGRRDVSQFEGVDLMSTFSHPWFVPRTLSDSIRLFGASQTPAQAAPHPLAPGADRYYRYAAGDSLVITMAGRRITLRSITVTPKRSDGAYVAGRIWLDVATGDVVRFIFRFVGTRLWAEPDGATSHDSAAAERTSRIVSQILELDADLEYSLQDNTHWLPYRQVISGTVTMPFGIDFAVPFEARTTFDDYQVNSGSVVTFDAPFPRDTAARGRNGGRIVVGRGGPPRRVGVDSGRFNRYRIPDSSSRRIDSARLAGADRISGGWWEVRDSSRIARFPPPLRRVGRFAGAGGQSGRSTSTAPGNDRPGSSE